MRPTSATGNPRRRRSESGFTLVEVLVALSLVALAGLALVELQSLQVRSSAALTATTLARVEADNQAIRLLLAPAAPAGTTSGETVNGGIPFRWEASAGPSPAPETFPELVTLDIRVSAATGGAPLATRQIVRPR